MILYRCEKDNIEVNSSVCPHCGQRAYPFWSAVYWCSSCKVPGYTKNCEICHKEGKRLATDLRPVFPEEKLLLEVILTMQQERERERKETANLRQKAEGKEKVSNLKQELTDFKWKEVCLKNTEVWNGAGNIYYADGKRLGITIGDLSTFNIEEIQRRYTKKLEEQLESYKKVFEDTKERFVKANQEHLHQIEHEAMTYIRSIGEQYPVEDMMISFSGGKDSTVVADLVTRSLEDGDKKILHIFGDTTLEFPATYEYVERYKKAHPKTPVLSSRNKDKNFMELCKIIGPPSRVMRWCCTIFKTGAITRKIEKLFRNKKHIVTFYGIRRSESNSRSKYEKETESPKITKQTVISPIIDWYDFDVWLYLLARRIDFNEAYRWGYARVGCWCCPNNSLWSEFLSRIHIPEQYKEFQDTLVEFAKQIGKPDPEEYVASGNWKARQGGNGVEMAQKSVISFTPCATEENTFHYELQKPVTEEFYELFKPFGELNFQMGNQRLGEVFVLNRKGQVLLKLQGRMGKKQLKVTIYENKLAGARSLKGAEEKIKCQITKYQMCMGCLACEGICRQDAITIKEKKGEVSYKISDEKCVRCGECIGHFNAGCYMRKVLAIKR